MVLRGSFVARMLGWGHSSYFCVFGWRCACERGRAKSHRRNSGRAVDASRRQLRRREGRLIRGEVEAGWDEYLDWCFEAWSDH